MNYCVTYSLEKAEVSNCFYYDSVYLDFTANEFVVMLNRKWSRK